MRYWGYHSLWWRGFPNKQKGQKFLKRRTRGLKIFDDQKVGSHKMITEILFILFKRLISIQFQPIYGARCIRGGGGGSLEICCRIGPTIIIYRLCAPFKSNICLQFSSNLSTRANIKDFFLLIEQFTFDNLLSYFQKKQNYQQVIFMGFSLFIFTKKIS